MPQEYSREHELAEALATERGAREQAEGEAKRYRIALEEISRMGGDDPMIHAVDTARHALY